MYILSDNSEPQLTGKTGYQWTQLLLQLLGEVSGQLSGISTGKHVAGSWWSVQRLQTLAFHDVRDSSSAGCVQWCDDSSKSPGELNDPLLSVVIRGLPLLVTSCVSRSCRLDMVLWLTLKSTATSRCLHLASNLLMANDCCPIHTRQLHHLYWANC